ncbi:hypothetical protein CUTA107171_12545 [Cupriavidus taiwanensis]
MCHHILNDPALDEHQNHYHSEEAPFADRYEAPPKFTAGDRGAGHHNLGPVHRKCREVVGGPAEIPVRLRVGLCPFDDR